MLCNRPEYPYAEVLNHDPSSLLSSLPIWPPPSSSQQSQSRTALFCRIGTGNRVQGITCDRTRNKLCKQTTGYEDWQKVPLAGQLYSHQSSHQWSMCYSSHQQSHATDSEYHRLWGVEQMTDGQTNRCTSKECWSEDTSHRAGPHTESRSGSATCK